MVYDPSLSLKRNLDDIINVTGFNEALITTKTPQFELKASTPSISKIRNVLDTQGSATITQVDGEILLQTTASGSDSAVIESATRGIYQAGHEAEAGVGIRVPEQTYIGTQCIKWGYFDANNGFYFGIDSGGVYIELISGGSSLTKVYQSNWNTDTLDGSKSYKNASALTLDTTKGNIFHIPFIYYGYGTIKFAIPFSDEKEKSGMKRVIVHKVVTASGLSTQNPNLPIKVEINNNGSANAISAYLAGRQFSVIGEFKSVTRITSESRGSVSLSASTWTPVISFRKKTGSSDQSQNVRISYLSAIASQITLVAFVSGGTLTGATFAKPSLVNAANETVLESDTSATTITDGEFVGQPVLIEASNKSDGISSIADFSYTLPNGQTLTMVAKNIGTAGNLLASLLSLSEEW